MNILFFLLNGKKSEDCIGDEDKSYYSYNRTSTSFRHLLKNQFESIYKLTFLLGFVGVCVRLGDAL